jgi:hypothetical protein
VGIIKKKEWVEITIDELLKLENKNKNLIRITKDNKYTYTYMFCQNLNLRTCSNCEYSTINKLQKCQYNQFQSWYVEGNEKIELFKDLN